MSRHASPRRRLSAAVAAVLLVGASVAGLGAVNLAAAAPAESAGTSTCTTDAAGYCTVAHELGAVPAGVLVTLVEPYRGFAGWDQPTAATWRLHVRRPDQDRPYVGSVTFSWRAWAEPAPTTEPPTSPPTTTEPSPTTVLPTTTEPAPTTPAPTTTPPAAGWPDGTNTGVPAGTTLTPYSGPCTITAAVVIDAVNALNCQALIIKATGVVIRRSNLPRIEQTDWDSGWSVTVEDSRISSPTWVEGVLWGFNITARRVNVTGGQHSFHCNDRCVLEDSWLHGQYNPAGQSFHNNAFITNGGTDMVVRHNTLHCDPLLNSTGGGCTADVALFGDFEPVTRVTVENSLLKANGSSISYCAYGGYQPSKPYPVSTYIVFSGNVFERGTNGKCGVYGPVTSWRADTGNEWTNNRWDDGTVLNP